MADASRIPRKLEDLNAYLINTSAYLATGAPTTNGVRLGILPAEQTQWLAINTQWAPLFVKYSDKKNTRTSSVIDQLYLLRQKLSDLDQTVHFLDRIAASPVAIPVDLDIFNIKKKALKTGTRNNVNNPITENVSPVLTVIGGGVLTVKCLTPNSKRAAIIKGADSVQYSYRISDTFPESPLADGMRHNVTSRASFTMSVGAENKGKLLHVFFRWNSIKRPDTSGPWCTLQTHMIV